jgi:small subunit ribosomal protein S6e
MPFKINISNKDGKTFHLETEAEALIGKKVGETINGEDIGEDLNGYALEIMGGSDKAGFPLKKDVEGISLKKVLLTRGFNLKRKPRREGKRKRVRMPEGLRMKKTVRGNTISPDVIQINVRVKKAGQKKLEEIFPGQGKGKKQEAEKKEE